MGERMEKFLKTQKKRLTIYRIVYILAFVAGFVSMLLETLGILSSAEGLPRFPIFSLCMGVAGAMIGNAVATKKTLKNEEKQRKKYIAETDERLLLIGKQTAHMSFLTTLVLLLGGAFVFAFIDATVFRTLMSVLAVELVAMIVWDIYYRKKY